MKIEDFPKHIQPYLIPKIEGKLVYRCLGCGLEFGIKNLLYTCPDCKHVLLIYDRNFERLKNTPKHIWHQLFDYRKMLSNHSLKGIYRYHEFICPIMPLDAIVYLGEGHTSLIKSNQFLQEKIGIQFYIKNDGQNPSASFKDRGMASAVSFINYLVQEGLAKDVLSICASTGDTSAAAALYAAYLNPLLKSAVLLPHKKVTPQQLSQPLGSGAKVFEIPGVFDDCMKVVTALSEKYNVALLNSKNAWRILGQESYSYEICQDLEYDLKDKVIVIPIGNAGNITAVINGFLKFYEIGIIEELPKILGVQSKHANPVVNYYQAPASDQRKFVPMKVKPSVAQAAMIGNPVSMPRVIHMVDLYHKVAGTQKIHFVEVAEQDIMDWQIHANKNGHISCTHGGESLAGLNVAVKQGTVQKTETAIIDSTAHAIKFSGFQQMYFENRLQADYNISPDPILVNAPIHVKPRTNSSESTLMNKIDKNDTIENMALSIAENLGLKKK